MELFSMDTLQMKQFLEHYMHEKLQNIEIS